MFDKKENMRKAYVEQMLLSARSHPELFWMDMDLSSSTQGGKFKAEFSHQYLNLGVAEQLGVGMLAGYAHEGMKPHGHTFAVFWPRAADFITNQIALNNLPVRLIGYHGGIQTGEDGPTAQAITDLAFMRALPNMKVVVPSDGVQVRAAVETIIESKGPVYVRLVRNDVPMIHKNESIPYAFMFGRGDLMYSPQLHMGAERDHATIVACGPLVANSLEAAIELEKEGTYLRVIDMASIKPIDAELLVNAARDTGFIFTAEDHVKEGGLYSAVAETLAAEYPVLMKSMSVPSFMSSGKPQELYRLAGFMPEQIMETVRAELKE